MATTKRGLDDGHAPGSKRRAPDPYEYERICDLPDALDCFADPRARSTPTGSAVSPHPPSAMPCQLGGHEPSDRTGRRGGEGQGERPPAQLECHRQVQGSRAPRAAGVSVLASPHPNPNPNPNPGPSSPQP